MSKVFQRLIIFFLGIPLILLVVHFPFMNHLPFNFLLVASCAIAAHELCTILNSGGQTLPKPLLIILAILIPISVYLDIILDLNYFFRISLFLSIFIIFTVEILSAKTFEYSNSKIVRSIFVILYAGFLPSFITRLTDLPNSSAYIMTFLVLVFMSDSAAWLFGVLFGKNNHGKIAASPNKSIAGFIGAYLGTILFAYIFAYIFFESAFDVQNKNVRTLVLAIIVCTTSIIGDLAESVFKRSANIKDSGKIIMGRGGMLDCVDSIFMSAPFYYYIIIFLFRA